jgi:hypothetical protein
MKQAPANMERGSFWWHVVALTSVITVFGVSFVMLSNVIGIHSPWLILLLMFYFLGIAKVAEPLFKLRMPSSLYAIREWERDEVWIRRLCVFNFGRMLRHTPLRFFNANVYLSRRKPDMSRVLMHAESAEATHFWAAVLFTPLMVYVAFSQPWLVVAVFLIVQVLFNIYPILHLRQTRSRIKSSAYTKRRMGIRQTPSH